MTASEILALTEQAALYAQQAQVALQQAQQPKEPPKPSFDPSSLRDDDFVDGRTLRQYLATVAQPYDQRFGSVYENIARQNVETVRAKFRDAFDRYGPEIQPWINAMPVEGRTIDALTAVVQLVLGQHIEDERKRVRDELAGDPTLRGNGSATIAANPGRPGSLVGSDELPADYRALLASKGITDQTVREFCASQGITPQEWYESAKKHNMNVITERSRRGG